MGMQTARPPQQTVWPVLTVLTKGPPDPAACLPGLPPKEMTTYTHTEGGAFTAALFVIPKGGDSPSVHQRMKDKRPWSVRLVDGDSAVRRDGALTRAATWMDPENTTPCETPDTEGHMLCGSVRGTPRAGKRRDGRHTGGCRGRGRGWGWGREGAARGSGVFWEMMNMSWNETG